MNKSVFVLAMLLAVSLAADFCWKNSYGRGVGAPLRTCKGNQEQNGALCYDRCSGDHYGVGPVCWQRCGPGYHDDGAFCRKDAHIYGKGCCCFFGACCSGKCPSDYHEDPCTCRRDAHIFAKHSYGRGAGYPLSCFDHEDQDAGLCYQRCSAGHRGVGPVCWGGCPAGWTDCGAACSRDSHECAGKIINMITETGFAAANTVALVAEYSGAVPGASKFTKVAQQAAKVAKIAAKSAQMAAKLAHVANGIFNAAKAKGEQITEAQASEMAAVKAGEVMGSGDGEGALNAALDQVANIDPTGIVAAAKTFVHPLCHQVQ